MNVNWLLFPTLALALSLCVIGYRSFARLTRWAKPIVIIFAAILSLPGICFALYYLHLFNDVTWFYEFRAMPASELTAAGTGLLAGVLIALRQPAAVPHRTAAVIVVTLLIAGICMPYIKPIIAPLPREQFEDRWTGDVCFQSTPSSCGAASAATLLRSFGVGMTERQIARECYTYQGGTECWYLARLFRRNGFNVRFIVERSAPERLPVPCIAGTRVGGAGHFIPIIAETETTYVTGDPTAGRQEWRKNEIRKHIAFTGFFMCAEPTR